MTRMLTHFGKSLTGWLRSAACAVLVAGAAVPAMAQYGGNSNFGDDFGPSPDSYLGRSGPSYDRATPPAPWSGPAFNDSYREDRFQEDRSFDSRRFDDRSLIPASNGFNSQPGLYGQSGSGLNGRGFFDDGRGGNGRDPVRQSGRHRDRLNGRDSGETSGGYGLGRDQWDMTRRSPADQGGFDSLPTTRERVPYDRVPQYDRPLQIGPASPAIPAAPASTLHPTVEQKISQRYQDPRVIRVLQSLTQQSGEAAYMELSQLIDSRHIEPTTYTQRAQSALEHLSIAAGTPSYQTALGLQSGSQSIPQFQQAMRQLAMQSNVQSANDAIGVMRQAGAAANQLLGVNPATVSLEFVYGALDTLDQYSMFVPPEKSGAPSMGLENNIVGIGVELESNPRGLMILKVLSGSPAAQATLRRGDIIAAVNGQSVAGVDLNQAVDKITGPQGSTVQLTIRRDDLVGDTTLMRQQVTIHSVADVRMEDPTNKIGYIKIEKFAESTSEELDAALWQLQQQGMQSLILDLRGNPGGLLSTCVAISDKFLPQGTIVSTHGRNPNDESMEVAHPQNTWKVPLVVMVDHNSASASEIFAAAIQDNHRGVIVGEKSYGKGTVQTLFPIQSLGSGLRLTTARFYSPKGVAMAGVGVTPDVLVPQVRNDTSAVDRGLQSALSVAQDPQLKNMANGLARNGMVGTGTQG